VKLSGEFLARREAAVDVEKFQEVDDRGLPVELLGIGGGELLLLSNDVDDVDWLGWRRRGWRRGRSRGGNRRRLWNFRNRCWSGCGVLEPQLVEDLAEKAHCGLLAASTAGHCSACASRLESAFVEVEMHASAVQNAADLEPRPDVYFFSGPLGSDHSPVLESSL
jgi:hypothetical protein